jgi:hypothetical protein
MVAVLLLAHRGARGDDLLRQLLDMFDRYADRGALFLRELH